MTAFAHDQENTAPICVLFLCTHNSSRSQMAEGLQRVCCSTRDKVFSAGTHPLAIKAMAELGIDFSEWAGHRATGIEESEPPMDLVVTAYYEAAEECPYFPRTRHQEHWSFPNPSAVTSTEFERLYIFRRVRDAIAERIDVFVQHNQEHESI